MRLDSQLLFLFSAIGALNGLFLTTYFLFFIKNKSRATYFLSALMLVVSLRILKSAAVILDPDISFANIGLPACLLIGPLLFLYIRNAHSVKSTKNNYWLLHLLAIVLLLLSFELLYSIKELGCIWCSEILRTILFLQWFTYLVLTVYLLRNPLRLLLRDYRKLTDEEVWFLSLTAVISMTWVGYLITQYTQWIIGALSFTISLYLLFFLWLYKYRKATLFFEQQTRYTNKKIDPAVAEKIQESLNLLFEETHLFKKPELKLQDVAEHLHIAPYLLSQFLNDNLEISFSAYVNQYRIEAACKMINTELHLTLEAIGQECGFKSNSSFYNAFKKIEGLTPAQYKKALK